MIELARMELDNFYKYVMPVVDYYDESNILTDVSNYLILNEFLGKYKRLRDNVRSINNKLIEIHDKNPTEI